MTLTATANGSIETAPTLEEIADAVVHRAQRQGYVLPRQIREELKRAGEEESLWKDVLALARASLNYRRGRYYYAPPVTERMRREQDHQETLLRAARQLIGQYREAVSQIERRVQDRIDFIQPVKVQTEDGRTFTLLSRDLSTSGMRLIGTRSLLGQKVKVLVPRTEQTEAWCFIVRILWTCAVGDDLFENGGTFVEAIPGEQA
jgi:hypothetical protein